MSTPPTFRRHAGFTLVEMLVVIAIILVLAGLLLPVISHIRGKVKVSAAKNAMNTIKVALDAYNNNFRHYPPHNEPKGDGSEILYHYLCRRIKTGESTFEAPLEPTEDRVKDTDGNGLKEVLSPLGTRYEYRLLEDDDGKFRTYLLVDPGPDRKLGGQIDDRKGWVTAGNGEDADNIFSQSPK